MSKPEGYDHTGQSELLSYYAQIPIIVQKETTPIELAVYTNIAQTIGANKSDFFKSHKTMAEETNTSIASVKRAITSLKRKGLISSKSQGKGKPNLLFLTKILQVNVDYANAKTKEDRKKIMEDFVIGSSEGTTPSSERANEPSSERATSNNSLSNNSLVTLSSTDDGATPAKKETPPTKAPKHSKAFLDSMFDEIALAMGHTKDSVKSKAVSRVIGQTRKAFLDEGFQLEDVKEYIHRVRDYYTKQQWIITDEVYKTDKNLALWAKAKANNAQITTVNGKNLNESIKIVTGDVNEYRNRPKAWESA